VAPALSTILTPLLGQTLAATEIITLLMVVSTALFGAQRMSERAFRLLRWCADRPEAPAPQLEAGRHKAVVRDR
jgi:hypothetical protein